MYILLFNVLHKKKNDYRAYFADYKFTSICYTHSYTICVQTINFQLNSIGWVQGVFGTE